MDVAVHSRFQTASNSCGSVTAYSYRTITGQSVRKQLEDEIAGRYKSTTYLRLKDLLGRCRTKSVNVESLKICLIPTN